MKYLYTYTREQRVYIEVVADNVDEAETKAWKKIEKLNLRSRDDESDDAGCLWLDEIEG